MQHWKRYCLISHNLNGRMCYMEILNIHKHDKILIIAPHPDDECIGPGGILIKYASQCTVLILTDGNIGQGDKSGLDNKVIRKQELIDEMNLLGIEDYHFLNYKDGSMLNNIDCLKKVNLSKYTKIFVTAKDDNHPDHRAAYLSVMQGMDRLSNPGLQVYEYEVHNSLGKATHMLDITSIIDKKIGLVQCHKSQLNVLPYDEYVKVQARYRALQNKLPGQYIEVYTKVDFTDNCVENVINIQLQKQIMFYQFLTEWVSQKIEGRCLGKFLKEKGYKKIAIYGYAELGKLFYKEVSQEGELEVVCIFDKKVNGIVDGIEIVNPEYRFMKVDAIVVTAIYYYQEIFDDLVMQGYKNIYSLQDLVER